jgi:hypothetical protein
MQRNSGAAARLFSSLSELAKSKERRLPGTEAVFEFAAWP